MVEGLIKVAEENKGGDRREGALRRVHRRAREEGLAKERELAQKLLTDYPKTPYTSDVLLTSGRHSAEAGALPRGGRVVRAGGQRMGGDGTGLDGWLAAARLRMALGDYPDAHAGLQAAANVGGNRKGEVLALLAEAKLKARDLAGAKAARDRRRSAWTRRTRRPRPCSPRCRPPPPASGPTSSPRRWPPVVRAPTGQSEDSRQGALVPGRAALPELQGHPRRPDGPEGGGAAAAAGRVQPVRVDGQPGVGGGLAVEAGPVAPVASPRRWSRRRCRPGCPPPTRSSSSRR